jgi:Xaa-Pro dipeptidase
MVLLHKHKQRHEGSKALNRFENRRKRAQAKMHEKEVTALQVTSRENYYYLTGDVRNVARLFLPQDGEPTVIVFDEEVDAARKATGISDVRGWRTPSQLMQTFFQVVKEHKAVDKKVGFCTHSNPSFLVYKFLKSNPKMKVIENEEILMPLRYAKDPEELSAMKRAAQAADMGITAAINAIKPGVTEIEVHSILPVRSVGGVKIEDTIQVTSKGGESLNRIPT